MKNVPIMKECCACHKVKELTSFYKNKVVPDGYFQRCKICMSTGVLCRQGRPSGMKYNIEERKPTRKNNNNGWDEIRLVNTSKKDYIETYEFLKKIGYKLDESIHEQFCLKYNLEPSEPREFKTHYSAEDCGLI